MSDLNDRIALVTGSRRAEAVAADVSKRSAVQGIAVNLKSVFLCTQAALPRMRARRWGRIVNLSSIGARIGAGSVSVAYGAAKAGVEGLTRAYALRTVAVNGGSLFY